MKKNSVKILLVEDSKTISQVIISFLNENGYSVTASVASGEEAIELTSQNEFGLIIMDIELSGKINGIEAARVIRNKINVPVMFMSGKSSLEQLQQAESLGVYSFIVKPVTEIVLISNIRFVLHRHHLEEQLLKSEAKLRTLFENMYDAFVYGTVIFDENKEVIDYEIIQTNEAFGKLFNLDRKKIIGTTLKTAYPNISTKFPEWQSILNDIISDDHYNKKKIKISVQKLYLILTIYRVSGDLIACVIEDQTLKTKAEESIRYSEEKYELVFNSSFDAHMIIDDVYIIDCNNAALEMFGLKNKRQLISKNPADFSPQVQPDGVVSYESAVKKIRTTLESGSDRFTWMHKKINGETFYADVMLSRFYKDNKPLIYATVRDINREILSQKKLEKANKQMHYLLESIDSIIIGVGVNDLVTHWSKKAEELLGLKGEDVIGEMFMQLDIEWDWMKIYEGITEGLTTDDKAYLSEVNYISQMGEARLLGIKISPIVDTNTQLTGFLIFGTDITSKKNLEIELLQSQKLRSIGELAAGIAHEINTPIQYVHDNTLFFKDAFDKFNSIFASFYDKVTGKIVEDAGQCLAEYSELLKEIDIEYLVNEVPIAIRQTLEGIDHIIKIVKSMKSFSHPTNEEKLQVNINKVLEDTITISRNEWKYVAEINTELDESLPEVKCFPADLNQVFLNIIVNAAHAIKEAVDEGKYSKGTISIATAFVNEAVEISIRDNGMGIDKHNENLIFDPFFTTKEIGKGTGQGLAISYSIIVNKHKGKIFFKSSKGIGTIFYIHLPRE